MGEIVSITIGNYDFISEKNTFGDLLLLYSPEDRQVVNVRNEDSETGSYNQYVYITNVERAKKCLDVLGYTINMAKISFENNKKREISFWKEYGECMPDYFSIDTIEAEFTFNEWSKAAQKFAVMISKDVFDDSKCEYPKIEEQRSKKGCSFTEKIILDSLPFGEGTFFGIDCGCTSVWEIFRVLLEGFDPEQEIILDYTNLYNGGWCKEYPEDDEFCNDKIIILTEGCYDTQVLLQSMQLLYPYMCKYYSFMDFSSVKVQGSTNILTQYIKAFIGAGIKKRVIALYDNDAAGCSEIENLKRFDIPDNFRIMTLPDIKLAEQYPTIGPMKDENININGYACSIELFLGKDILMDSGSLTPIMWKGYVDKIGRYQGEIIKKSEVQKRFEKKVQIARQNKLLNEDDWLEMDLLLNFIFRAFR